MRNEGDKKGRESKGERVRERDVEEWVVGVDGNGCW
jgi:hypothetical protein